MTEVRRALRLMALSLVVCGTAIACGSDEGDRGLQPSGEVAVPDSTAQNAQSEEERAKERIRKEQSADARDFDQAEED